MLQQDIFAGWKRPQELLSTKLEDTDHVSTPVMSVSGKTDLVQDVLTDCSVVASLCATTSRLERGLVKVKSSCSTFWLSYTNHNRASSQYPILMMNREIQVNQSPENTYFAFTSTDVFERLL